MARRGFSLIELTLVTVVLALLAAAVTLRVQGPMRRCATADLLDRLVQFDRLTRVQAQEHDRPMRLIVDLARGTIRRTSEDETEEYGSPLELPDGYRFVRLHIRDEDIAGGSAALVVGQTGLTPTYALEIETPDGQRRWVSFLGLTGEALLTDREENIRNILAATKRRNAG
ncbi:MAG TPA: prepilin-type N-terminal cleavage/methylation domain-containing protein [Phycisphaerae bacterium]|nr:prepilin-type N-terminal cleavage/methylation domain-containing protein [Phycisphaerae bacterium]